MAERWVATYYHPTRPGKGRRQYLYPEGMDREAVKAHALEHAPTDEPGWHLRWLDPAEPGVEYLEVPADG